MYIHVEYLDVILATLLHTQLIPAVQRTMSATKIFWYVLLVIAIATCAICQQDDQEDGPDGGPPPCSLPIHYPARVLGQGSSSPNGNFSCASEEEQSQTLESIRNDTRRILRDVGIPILRGEGFCDMGMSSCGGPGWRLRALLNATREDNVCPPGFSENPDPLSCVKDNNSSGCTSSFYFGYNDFQGPYERVCGIVFGFQYNAPNAFEPYNNNPQLTLDDAYVDGVSLTHGPPGNREHIWTWAAGSSEIDSGPTVCPCTNNINPEGIQIPPFVGMDYFCETGATDTPTETWYNEDPLWEGNGCHSGVSSCCVFNRQPEFPFPVFDKQLSGPTTDPLEVRLCRDEMADAGEVGISLMLIFVR